MISFSIGRYMKITNKFEFPKFLYQFEYIRKLLVLLPKVILNSSDIKANAWVEKENFPWGGRSKYHTKPKLQRRK
jgi:hypothetical protein